MIDSLFQLDVLLFILETIFFLSFSLQIPFQLTFFLPTVFFSNFILVRILISGQSFSWIAFKSFSCPHVPAFLFHSLLFCSSFSSENSYLHWFIPISYSVYNLPSLFLLTIIILTFLLFFYRYFLNVMYSISDHYSSYSVNLYLEWLSELIQGEHHCKKKW